MTREEAIYILKNTAWLGSAELAGDVTEAVKMAVNVLNRSEAPNSSDTISRQAVLQRLTDIAYNSCKTEGQVQVIDWAKTLVCVMPSTQPEIIRCKDCKYFDSGTDEDGKLFFKCLGWVYGGTSEDDFCSRGERKDG